VHALRDALVLPARKIADDCLTKLRWLYDGRNAEEGRRDLAAWLLRWQEKYPRLCVWVEENIEETLALLPTTSRASQASQEHQYARATQSAN
jgi:putative transposase